jgi:hypothetical protein
MLAYGYLNKERPEIVGSISSTDDIKDNYAVDFNNALENCKIFGLMAFMAGGAVLAFSLLLSSFLCYKQCIYQEDLLFGETATGGEAPSNVGGDDGGGGASSRPHLMDFKHIQPQSINKVNPAALSNVNYKTIKSEF